MTKRKRKTPKIVRCEDHRMDVFMRFAWQPSTLTDDEIGQLETFAKHVKQLLKSYSGVSTYLCEGNMNSLLGTLNELKQKDYSKVCDETAVTCIGYLDEIDQENFDDMNEMVGGDNGY